LGFHKQNTTQYASEAVSNSLSDFLLIKCFSQCSRWVTELPKMSSYLIHFTGWAVKSVNQRGWCSVTTYNSWHTRIWRCCG